MSPVCLQVLAEQRREALAETLLENEELYRQVARLEGRVAELEEQAHSGRYFAMMYHMASEGSSSTTKA